MNIIIQIVSILFWFVVILIPLVAFHEFGHLSMAKLFGVKIPEYAIGMPLVKRTFYTRWKGIIWSFYWPLLGGFVRIWGDNDAIDEAWETAKDDQKKAREEYVTNRFQELLATRELQFLLEDNNVEFTKEWEEFAYSEYAKGKEVEKEKEKQQNYQRLYNQVATLIEWEFDQEIDSPKAFYNKNWLQQSLIIAGGVIFNLILAFFLFFSLFTFISISNNFVFIDDISRIEQNANISSRSEFLVTSVVDGGLAASIGMQSGDELWAFNQIPMSEIDSQNEFKELVQDAKGQEIEVEFQSIESGQRKTEVVRIEETDEQVLFGLGPLFRQVSFRAKGPINGARMALSRTSFIFTETFNILGDILMAIFPGQDRTALNFVGGPIAVGSVGSSIFEQAGIAGIIEVMGVVSVSLAVFNMLPIPALDGGRWIIITINKILGKRNRKLEATAISVTFLAMLVLAAVIAVRDVQGIIAGRF